MPDRNNTTSSAYDQCAHLHNVLPPEIPAAAEWFPCQPVTSANPKAPRAGLHWTEVGNRGTLAQLVQVIRPDEVCGLALGESAPITIIDLDRVLDPRDGHLHTEVEPLVMEALRRGAFVERSASGRGLHIITQRVGLRDVNDKPLGICGVCLTKHESDDVERKPAKIEWWSGRDGSPARYVVLTGDCYHFCAEGQPLVSAAGAMTEMLLPYADSSSGRTETIERDVPPSAYVSEEEIEDAMHAALTHVGSDVRAMMLNGDATKWSGDRSRAVMACAMSLIGRAKLSGAQCLDVMMHNVFTAAPALDRRDGNEDSARCWMWSYVVDRAEQMIAQENNASFIFSDVAVGDVVAAPMVSNAVSNVVPFTRSTVRQEAERDAGRETPTPLPEDGALSPQRRLCREMVYHEAKDGAFYPVHGGSPITQTQVQARYGLDKRAVDNMINTAYLVGGGDGEHTLRIVGRVTRTWALPWGVQPDPICPEQKLFNFQRMQFGVQPSEDDLWQVEVRLTPLLSIWQRVYGDQLSVILDYLAMLVQRPNLRLSKMLLLQGSTGGEGKTLFKVFLDAVFGITGVAPIDQTKLVEDSKFEGQQLDTARVAFLDELTRLDPRDPAQKREITAVVKFIMRMTGQSSGLVTTRHMRSETAMAFSSASLIATTNNKSLFDLGEAGMNRRVIPIIARNPYYQPLRGVSKKQAAGMLRDEYAPVLARMGLREGESGAERSQVFRDLLALLLARPTDHLDATVCSESDPRTADAFAEFTEAHAEVSESSWAQVVVEAVARLGAAEGVDIITSGQRKRLLEMMAPEGWDNRPVPHSTAIRPFKEMLREVRLTNPLPKATRVHCTSPSMLIDGEEWLLDSKSGLYRRSDRSINSRDEAVSTAVRDAIERTEQWLLELERTHKPSVSEVGTPFHFG